MAVQYAKTRGSLAGAGCLALFGLPFFGVGCVMGYLIVSMIWEWSAARNWIEVPATVEFVELTGDESKRVVCRYSYAVNEKRYEGERVGFAGGGDNIGSWQQDTYQRLQRSRSQEKPVPCYVNPNDPEQSLLDRDIRFGLLAFFMLFGLVFGGVGSALLLSGFLGVRWEHKEAALKAAHRDEPWLCRMEWANDTIGAGTRSRAVVAWCMAAFWNSVSFPIWLFLPGEVADGNYVALIALLFPMVGIALLTWAVRETLQHRRFGRSYVKITNRTGVIGGRLRGELQLVGDLLSLDSLDITLICENDVTTGSGKNRSTRSEQIWTESRKHEGVSPRFGQTEIVIPFDFQIPYECRPSDKSDSGNTIEWKLQANADIPGVDLSLEFPVPVFKTAQSDPNVGLSDNIVAAREAVIVSDTSPDPLKLRWEPGRRGEQVLTAIAFPGPGALAAWICFALVVSGVAGGALVFLLRGECFAIPFAGIFGLVSLFMWYAAISMLGSYTTVSGPQEVRITRRIGPYSKIRHVDRAEISAMGHKEFASSGATKWYAVYLTLRTGAKVNMAGMVKGEVAALWIVRRMEEALTLTSQNATQEGEESTSNPV